MPRSTFRYDAQRFSVRCGFTLIELLDTPAFAVWEFNPQVGTGAGPYTLQISDNGIGFQIAPRDGFCDYKIQQTGHTGAMQVGLLDGSVRGVSGGISVTTWTAVCNPDLNVPPGSDW